MDIDENVFDTASTATSPPTMAAKHSSTLTVSQDQLPIWPQELRGMPNAFARSALFNVANARKGKRSNLKRAPIAALRGITITYTGEELRQDDDDVYLQILHIARMHPLGTYVQFTAHSMLRELGWSINNGSYKRLVDCLDRLKASAVAVTVEGLSGSRTNYTGSLIRSFKWKEDGEGGVAMRHWEILLEKEILALFGSSAYSRLEWKLRLKLPPLAKWLHSFYHTHAQPFDYSVAKLYELCGSETAELRQYRYNLRKALELLVDKDFFASAVIDARTDLVKVVRRSQALELLPRVSD